MKNISIRKKLIIGIFIACLIPYFLGGMYLKTFIEKGLFNNSIEHTSEILSQVNENINNSFIRDVNEEINLLSSLDFIKNSSQNLNNYLDYENINFLYKKTEIEFQVNSYFKLFKDSHNFVNFVFLATSDGGYTEYPTFAPMQNYDPRTRPWYSSTFEKENIVISDPYLTKVTNEMIVSFTKSVTNNDKHIGVVGVSVSIDDLTNKISNIKIGNSGYILVMNQNNKIIVSPKNQEWILKTPSEVGIESLSNLDFDTQGSFEAELDGIQSVIGVVISENSGWKIISVVDKSEILNNSKDITSILMLIYAMTLFIIFIVVYNVLNEITRPILGITKIIKKMANFDFSDSDQIEKYTNSTREIDTIAYALEEMHVNFSELMSQISKVDKEIRDVDIEKNSVFKLELSDNNPFSEIGKSINTLLDKIYSSFTQLKSSNNEINEKNKLLTLSEQELREQVVKIEKQREYINFLALHDSLTNLPNRRNFVDVLNSKINSNQKGAVVLIDLDNFKSINDTLGHVFGDKLLQAIADRLRKISNETIFVSRFGGDEFLILIDLNDNNENLNTFVKLISEIFDEKFNIEDNQIEITSSIGISLFPKDSTDVNQLIMNADLALYSVKKLSKNAYKYFDETMKSHLFEKSTTELILKNAIENDGFNLLYQPQVDIKTGHIYGYEALIRLSKHSISPADFISIAEESGLIIKIGRIVTEKVIYQLSLWRDQGICLKPVAINFSANQIHDSNYIEFLIFTLEKYDIDPSLIEIEITESIFLENKNATLAFLKQLRDMGIKIAIDDFGTGYSSLSYLTFLPVDKIKLDKSLNDRFLELENIKVMDSLISLAHSLNLSVVAEGIELIDHVRRLKFGGCDYIQGYYFSKPLHPDLITNNFTNNRYET